MVTMSFLETAHCAPVLSGHCFLLWIPVEGHCTCATNVPGKGACKISKGCFLVGYHGCKTDRFLINLQRQYHSVDLFYQLAAIN